jgi:diguanylate cyclase (GGDEF)-like protein/PAS domain S-box-containing protein
MDRLQHASRSLAGSAAAQAEGLLRALTAHTAVGVFVSDRAGACLFVNDRWCELTGLAVEQALGDGWSTALHPDDRERVTGAWAEAADREADSVAEYRFLRPDGSVAWIKGYASAFRHEGGELAGWIGSCVDLTAEKLAERALAREQETFRAAFEDAPLGMALVSPDGAFLRVNRSICALLGYERDELLARCFQELTHPADLEADVEQVARLLRGEVAAYKLEKRYIRKDGSVAWGGLSVSLIRDPAGAPMHFVAHVEDIGDRKHAERRLRHAADRDSLTGLLNRRRFFEELGIRLDRLAVGGSDAALVLVDVDRFKDVNDTHGHGVGDRALVAVAGVLRRSVLAGDLVARIGGDEFAVLASTPTADARRRLADDLVAAVRCCELVEDGRVVHLTASAGLAPLAGGMDAVEVIEAADAALYRAKRGGRDRSARAQLGRAA